METTIRGTYEWIKLFRDIQNYKEKNGATSIFDATHSLLELKEQRLVYLGVKSHLFDDMWEFGFTSILSLITFLDRIKNIYNYDRVIENILLLKEKYDVDKMGFIHNDYSFYNIETYFNMGGIRKVILPNDVTLYKEPCLNANGLCSTYVYSNQEFMVQEVDFKSLYCERCFYTNNLRFNLSRFPRKEEMNIIQIEEERNSLFKFLLSFFKDYPMEIIVDNPNKVYSQFDVLDINDYFTIHSDGVMQDSNYQVIKPGVGGGLTTKLLVQNASFVVLLNLCREKVKFVQVIVHEKYYQSVRELLDEEGKKLVRNKIS